MLQQHNLFNKNYRNGIKNPYLPKGGILGQQNKKPGSKPFQTKSLNRSQLSLVWAYDPLWLRF